MARESQVLQGHIEGKTFAGQPALTTDPHPFFSETRHGWVAARDLAVGERVSTTEGPREVVGSRRLPGARRVYNIEDAHTYFVAGGVGAAGVWVHNQCPQVYDVGLAKDLRNTAMAGTQVHHVPGSRQAESLVGGHSAVNKYGHEPAIRLPTPEHEAVTAAQAARTRVPASARELLAQEIRDLRKHTNAPNAALKGLLKINYKRHPYDYAPLHRSRGPSR